MLRTEDQKGHSKNDEQFGNAKTKNFHNAYLLIGAVACLHLQNTPAPCKAAIMQP